jgi:hypothetical protein
LTRSTDPVNQPALLVALGLACDLRARPWTYPGLAAPGPGVLIGSHFHPVLAGERVDDVLRREGVAPADRRTLVAAVGSNGAPDVLRAKFARAGVSGVVPFLHAEVHGIGVGHSAHVSLPGFVAAAPFRAPGAVTPVVASLLDDDQVEALDASERTYTRRPMTGERWSLRLAGDDVCGTVDWWLYDSDQGVLADAPGSRRALRLHSQAALLTHLAAADPALGALLGDVDPIVALPALAASESRRRRIRGHLAERWALASGL